MDAGSSGLDCDGLGGVEVISVFAAADQKDNTAVTKFIQSNPGVVHATRDEFGETLLHIAAGQGNTNLVHFLLEFDGTIVNQKDYGGTTALHYACRGGHVGAAQVLIEHGAAIDECNNKKQTPLLVACEGNHEQARVVDLVKALVEHGADINAQDNRMAKKLDEQKKWRDSASPLLQSLIPISQEEDVCIYCMH